MVQLLITVSFIAWFTYHEPTKHYVREHQGIWWAAFAIMIVCLITMACCGDVRRKAPMNFIFLFLFTVAEAFMLGVASSTYDTDAVCNNHLHREQDSSVTVLTSYGQDDWVQPLIGTASRLALWSTKLPAHWVLHVLWRVRLVTRRIIYGFSI
jgi:hypothetical protein